MRSISTSENPMIALSGVRSSCDMLARNSLLCWLAVWSCRVLILISRESSAFWVLRPRLRLERLQEVDHLGIEFAGALPVHREPAQQVVVAHERHREHRPVAQAQENFADAALIGAFV